MKKLVSLMLVLMMALTCTVASADSLYAKVAVDREQAATLATLYGVDDSKYEMVDTALAVVNALGVNVTTVDNAGQVDIDLNGTDILSLGFSTDESGLALASTLFPNYIVTVSQETVGQMMEQMTAAMSKAGGDSGVDQNAMMQIFGGYFQSWFEACAAAGKPGDPVTGEYWFGGYTFDTMVPITVDVPAIAAATTTMVDQILADDNAMAVIQGYVKNTGKELSKDDIKAGFDEWIAHFPETVTAEFYTNSDGSEPFYLCGESIMADEQKSALSYYLLYENANTMTMACDIGTGDEAIEIMFAMEEGAMSMSFGVGELYVGLALYFTDGGFSGDLYFINTDEPLVSVLVTTIEGGEITVTTDATGKKVVSVEDIMADEKGDAASGLVSDIASNGMSVLISAVMAVPELSGLMSLLSA